MDNVKLSEEELLIIAELKRSLLNEYEIEDFNIRYEAWKNTWSNPKICFNSNVEEYAKSEEYFEFYNFCVSQGKKVFPLILEKLNSGDFYTIVPIQELTYPGNESLMKEVHQENREHQYTKDDVFIIHTLIGNWLKYGKKLLAIFNDYRGFNPSNEKIETKNNINNIEDELIVQNYPNPFNPSTQINYNIPSESKISIKIFNILGKEIAVLTNNELQTAGWHRAKWNGRDINDTLVSSGIYFCRIIYNSQVYTLKMMLIR